MQIMLDIIGLGKGAGIAAACTAPVCICVPVSGVIAEMGMELISGSL